MVTVAPLPANNIDLLAKGDQMSGGPMKLTGRLVHADATGQRPLAHAKVEVLTGLIESPLFDRVEEKTGFTKLVASCRTDKDGYFTLDCPEKVNLLFQVARAPHAYEDPHRRKMNLDPWKRKVFYEEVLQLEPGKSEHNIGVKALEYFEYIPGWGRLDWPKIKNLCPKKEG